MAFNPNPASFFGPSYSAANGTISIKANQAAGITTGTTFSCVSADTLTTVATHNLLPDDRIRFTAGTTLPTGLVASTDYWVKAVGLVSPETTARLLTISSSKRGSTLAIPVSGTANNTIQAMGSLDEISNAEMAADSSGDWRKVFYGVMEMLYSRWNNTPQADRPQKVSISRNSSVNETTGSITKYYTVSISTEPSALEVTPE
jgi:hypothetical protein